ncbi:PREDICTED: prostaglandin E synthase 3 [Haliaeetus leucocephalus]|uniref:prostaglandin E synthase 3 n=1 Tax=Haliaeetus leucocephalus TaxID=52644 RepID=UPI00053CB8CC|nr:PREDICTED: prostaglandin E synthase 3 [Haliaeetus leucocephalus]
MVRPRQLARTLDKGRPWPRPGPCPVRQRVLPDTGGRACSRCGGLPKRGCGALLGGSGGTGVHQTVVDKTAKNSRQPASAKWYDRRDYVFIEFCVEDSKDVNVNFEKSKLTFSCLGGSDNFKHLNEIDLFNNIDPNESKHKRTDRSILCCLRKGESGQAWPRLTKERAKLNWLSVDFNNWKDWEDDSDEDMSNFDRFSEMMNNMGGDDDVDLPEVDGADDDSPDSDDEKMPDLE